ncbi:competence protein CoiA [Vagococcus intermedius]|uniref:Competence protein CoiA family protein n=1 Tax=Vagococcus intermedius TaxID=2991418 RepID=A0AAF0I894_9ENTE|nr:competence protein CoiA family protein [Vagococcus intermedius]WEG73696.1 competence protein CoiA family protein [Vagococcus intermedius]WEG75780.1 competence protein CoiA family protein [Vagococcus intermedius]
MLVALDACGKKCDLRQLSMVEGKKNLPGNYRCPCCKKAVILKNGLTRRAHFAHKSIKECATFSEGETAEHLLGKKLLADWCDKNQKPYELEAYLPRLKQRPDMLLSQKIVIEFQCSSLPLARLVKRTNNYLKNDYHVIWLVGRQFFVTKKLTRLQKAMINFSRRLGFYLWELDVIKQEVRCVYQIEERLISKEVIKSYKKWPLGSCSLATCFTFPEKAKIYQQRLYNITTEVDEIKSKINLGLAYKNLNYLHLQERCYLSQTYLQYFPYGYFGLLTDNLISADSTLLWWLQIIDYFNHHSSNRLEIAKEQLAKGLLTNQNYQIMPMIDCQEIIYNFVLQAIKQLAQQGIIQIDEKMVRVLTIPIFLDSRVSPYKHQDFNNKTMSLKSCIPYENVLL